MQQRQRKNDDKVGDTFEKKYVAEKWHAFKIY